MSVGSLVDEQPRRRLASAWRSIALGVLAAAGVATLAAIVFTLADADRQRDRALEAQRHSYDVMVMARTLQGVIARSEASLGRFVISGDQQQGALYYQDWRRAAAVIDRLQQLTRDNRHQTSHLSNLRRSFAKRGSELSETALATNYGKNDQALSRYWQLRRTESLGQINRTLNLLIADERQLLEYRTSHALASIKRSNTIAKVLAVFGVLLVLGAIAMGWLMVEALAQRALAEDMADKERERADELAAAVEKATDELRAQEAQLRQVQKMEAVGQLTGGIAHDFNNMLAVVLGGMELAQRHLATAPDEAARHLESAHDGARRAMALTSRLLAFARETAINPEPIGATWLFGDLGDLLRRTLGTGVTVTFRDSSGGWKTRADRVQLENTIVNLAVNARDAMQGRGTLTIVANQTTLEADESTGRPAGDFLTIAVSDTGCGIAPEVIERVFEPFFTTKPVGKGTGLGLSQTFAFARQVGGDVTIASVVGSGTTVTLLLPRDRTAERPLAPPAPGAGAAPAPAPVPPPSSAATPASPAAPVVPILTPTIAAGLSILVVEDDTRVLSATMEALTELGHRPVACDDPLMARSVLAGMAAIDLIISDVMMPVLTGPEMIAALPEDMARVPVLFVTGFAGGAGSAIDLGGRPVLRKPFTLAGLEAAVSRAAVAAPSAPLAPEQVAAE
ncbi:ATP-binding protein [Sphingomonas adhaesiva]|uniref:ATP-binding protein n=1 Tax=Sphingomonas adhaesiva TaxID=28212 RepID=UPI002FFB3753